MAALLGGLGALPGVGGVLDKAGGLAGKVGLGGLVPTTTKPEDAVKDKIKQFVTEGFPIGKPALFVLAGAIFVAPFSFWGYGAVNLMVAGSKGWAAAKAALQMVFVLANKFLGTYYPKLWWVGWLLVLNPWYVFDLVQLCSPTFESEGFKVPFYGEQIRPEDGVYKLNGIVIGIMMALLTAGGFSLLDYLPPEVVGGAKPALELALKVIGGVTAAAGGGLGLLMLPSLKQTIVQGVAGVKSEAAAAAAAVPAAAAAPGTLPAAAVPAAPLAQKGGSGQGGAIPSLREIAAGLLGPAPGGDPGPFKSTVITGGGGAAAAEASTSSLLFVGTLGLAALGGIALAVTRSKGDSLA
jgi:hypothetical protein